MMDADMDAADAENRVEQEGKTQLTNGILELNTHLNVSLYSVFWNDTQLITIPSL